MSRFTNNETGVTVSVADKKDHRFDPDTWHLADGPAPKAKTRAKSPKAKAPSSEPTVAELKTEIDRRNALRDEADQIPATGKKAELLAALAADDQVAGQAEPIGEFLEDEDIDDDAVEQFIAADGTAG